MQRWFSILVVVSIMSSCTNTYYIVRHAEKAAAADGVNMVTTNDPPLSNQGETRAITLGKLLEGKRIGKIYSTNTKRTLSTAEPVAGIFKIRPETYAQVDAAFINILKKSNRNTLIVGHSNTVDDIVNGMTGQPLLSDLPDSAYNNIYIIRRKGQQFRFKSASFNDFP